VTIANQTNRTSAVGSGVIGQEVPFTFPITATSDLLVKSRVIATGVETTLTETTDYTVSISGDTGGTLTTVTAVAATSEIHLIRNTPKTQSLDLEAGGSFNAENVEDAIDKNTKLSIENKDAITRSLRAPDTDAVATDMTLPNSVDRASKNLGFDASGNPTVTSSSGTFTSTYAYWNDLEVKSPWHDVRAYGAEGDGTTDDSAAIQAAYDAAIAAGGGIVFLPIGDYLINTGIALNTIAPLATPVIFKGAGAGQANGTAPGTVLYIQNLSDGEAAFTYSHASDFISHHYFEDFAISGTAAGTEVLGDGDGFNLNHTTDCRFTNLDVRYCKIGMETGANFLGNVLDRVSFLANGKSFVATGTFNANTFNQCQFRSASDNGYSFEINLAGSNNVQNNVLHQCWFESNKYGALGILAGSGVRAFAIDGGHFEGNCITGGDYAISVEVGTDGFSMTNAYTIEDHAGAATLFLGKNVRNTVLIGNTFGYANTTASIAFGENGQIVYSPILIGNILNADAAGKSIYAIGTCEVRDLVSIGNDDAGTTSLIQPIFHTHSGYTGTGYGSTVVKETNTETLTDDGTFAPTDPMVHFIDPGGADRNFNPSGTFIRGTEVTIVNTADADEVITFDTTDLAARIYKGGRATFVLNDSSVWKKISDNTNNVVASIVCNENQTVCNENTVVIN